MELGRGSLLAKIDIKSAYRLIPIHPHNRKLFGIQRHLILYISGMLPWVYAYHPNSFQQ